MRAHCYFCGYWFDGALERAAHVLDAHRLESERTLAFRLNVSRRQLRRLALRLERQSTRPRVRAREKQGRQDDIAVV